MPPVSRLFYPAVALLLCLAVPAVAAPLYSITVIPGGADPARHAFPMSLNDNGQVVGALQARGASGSSAFFWSQDAGLTEIGDGFASSINNGGAVAGTFGLWTSAGGIQSIPVPASAINNAGTVAGSSGTWSASVGTKSLPVPAGFQNILPSAINDDGYIVGWVGAENEVPTAVIWHPNGIDVTILETLPVSGSSSGGHAYAINADGVVAGEFNTRAFAWQDCIGMIDLGTGPFADVGFAAARGLNDDGLIVGNVEINSQEDSRAFLWSHNTGMLNLNDLLDQSGVGWTLESAWDINASGQIVGVGLLDGVPTGFLLTPTSPVPEPAAALGLCAAALLLLRRTRRRMPLTGNLHLTLNRCDRGRSHLYSSRPSGVSMAGYALHPSR